MFQCSLCKRFDDSEPFIFNFCGFRYHLCWSCADLVFAFGFDNYEM